MRRHADSVVSVGRRHAQHLGIPQGQQLAAARAGDALEVGDAALLEVEEQALVGLAEEQEREELTHPRLVTDEGHALPAELLEERVGRRASEAFGLHELPIVERGEELGGLPRPHPRAVEDALEADAQLAEGLDRALEAVAALRGERTRVVQGLVGAGYGDGVADQVDVHALEGDRLWDSIRVGKTLIVRCAIVAASSSKRVPILLGVLVVVAVGSLWLRNALDGEARSPADPTEPAGREAAFSEVLYPMLPEQHEATFDEALLDETPPPRATPAEPTVVLIVLDTVRADRTSLCGHSRGTTPFLARLSERNDTVHSCRAYTPGDWSLPTHASYFTGEPVSTHGAHYAIRGEERETRNIRSLLVHPMREGIPTLADRFGERGYQTVLVTDNSLLREAGLESGFEIIRARPLGHRRNHPFASLALRQVLREQVDPERPLFLVLNFLDAHDPWLGLPEEDEWPDFEETALGPGAFREAIFHAIRPGATSERVEAARRQLMRLYDYGVLREDRQLERAWGILEDAGWLTAGHRIAITADHGEMLLEHRMWRHSFIFEGNVRVPLVFSTDGELPDLPTPTPAIVVHDLLLEGRLPDPMPLVHTVAVPNPNAPGRPPADRPAIAYWPGEEEKLVWMGGEYFRFGLDSDPRELSPIPLGDHPGRETLERLVAAFEMRGEREATVDDSLVEQLEALGYVR